ncbi:hypothetical protein CHS0354_015707 [Potamilus streckersoni]|uniref:Uncharacterized protein n=1 Tax=Potamilus streckersoni TaxID=2493646 RepID=A0AAE0WEI9_9BIVA|nr:hypothetical protein CHS0354_015707 [Potamilus streckersoni]
MKQYIVGAPSEQLAMDILSLLPETVFGNRYMLVGIYLEETGDHVGRMSKEDQLDSDPNRLSVLSDRIDLYYGINDLSSTESIKLADLLILSPRRVTHEP